MNNKSLISIALVLSIVGVSIYLSSSQQEELVDDEVLLPTEITSVGNKISSSDSEEKVFPKFITNSKKIAKVTQKTKNDELPNELNADFLFFLNNIKDNNLENISREERENIVKFLQDQGKDLKLEYSTILEVYKSNISKESKKFLLDLLSEIGSYDSAQLITKVLDLKDNIPDSKKKAIEDLVNNPNIDFHQDVSVALLEYYNNTKNKMYKPTVTSGILKIGSNKEVKNIIERLNNPSNADEVEYISDAMKGVKKDETTNLIYKAYNDEKNTQVLKKAAITALPDIANRSAILSLYDWSTKTSDVEEVKRLLTTLREKNPDSIRIVREELFENGSEFTSQKVRREVDTIFTPKEKKIN